MPNNIASRKQGAAKVPAANKLVRGAVQAKAIQAAALPFTAAGDAGGAAIGTGVTSVNTRTGAVVLAKADVVLGNVDNTSDANKPVSTAQAAADSAVQSAAASDATTKANAAQAAAIAASAQRASNLSDLASASAARGNLGLGTAAVQNTTAFDAAGAAAAAAAAAASDATTKANAAQAAAIAASDPLGSAATVQGNLGTHAALTTAAHGGIVATTDARLSDARTPTAHAGTHGAAGSDPITITESQVTNLGTDLAAKVAGPGTVVSGHAVVFNGTSGTSISDAGERPLLNHGNGSVGLLVHEAVDTAMTVSYATGGSVQMRFDLGNFAYIGLTVNISLSPAGSAGLVQGRWQQLVMKNTTGSNLTLTVNASWVVAGSLPSSLASGASVALFFEVNGASETDVNVAVIASTGVISVATRTDLRALAIGTLTDGQIIAEAGYAYTTDWGGGFWIFVKADNWSTDNDGTLVVPGGSYGTAATVGCLHRYNAGTKGASLHTGGIANTTVWLPWFGGTANDIDCSTALTRAFAALQVVTGSQQQGTIYAPGGTYKFVTKVVLDCFPGGSSLSLVLKGDGPGSTYFQYALAAPDTCMIEVLNATGGAVQDLAFIGGGTPAWSPRVLWINACTQFSVINVQGLILTSTLTSGLMTAGMLTIDSCTTTNVFGCIFAGNGASGCVFAWVGNSSGIVSSNTFITDTTCPAIFIKQADTLLFLDNILQGAGPYKTFSSVGITSTGSDFTVNQTAHGWTAGDYVIISGATHTGYNSVWKIATVPNANSFTITSAANLGTDTVTLTTLLSEVYCGTLTESKFARCFFNTPPGGVMVQGSIGLWLDGWPAGQVHGTVDIDSCFFDYGWTGLFLHGKATSYPSSSILRIQVNGLTMNGGPRDDFGAIRVEGCAQISISNPEFYPGRNPPGTGLTFNSLVISDGGQAYPTQDISLVGGILTGQTNSTDFNAATAINAIVLDGANVKRFSASGFTADSTNAWTHILSLVNSATLGSSVIWCRRDDGRLAVWDSTGSNRAL